MPGASDLTDKSVGHATRLTVFAALIAHQLHHSSRVRWSLVEHGVKCAGTCIVQLARESVLHSSFTCSQPESSLLGFLNAHTLQPSEEGQCCWQEGTWVISLGTSGTLFGVSNNAIVDPEGSIAPFSTLR